MGACDFTHSIDTDKDMQAAFDEAVADARYEYGHGGYTGTLADKDSVILVGEVETWEEAEELSAVLLGMRDAEEDERISDKWGPAGAIKVKGKGWSFIGIASS